MESEGVYPGLSFGDAPADRPYIFMNMVSTIDGKIVTGNRNEPVQDLGSSVDHASMRQIENAAQAVLIGAGNLRSTPKIWYPSHLVRIVATRSGGVPATSRFFTDAPEKAFVLMAESASESAANGVQSLVFGQDSIDWFRFFRFLRLNKGIKRLLIEGGSELNAAILRLNLVDELFLTVAPKIKLGSDIPTYAGGRALERELVQDYKLISSQVKKDEIFLRYHRDWNVN